MRKSLVIYNFTQKRNRVNNYKSLSYLILLSTFLMLYACNPNSEKQSKTKTRDFIQAQEEPSLTKVYTVKGNMPFIKWTAYKFTNRTGVSGSFDNVTYKLSTKKGTVKQLLEYATFKIETESVNSNLKLRDDRIYTYFFSKIGAKTITGDFLKINDKGGQINIVIGNNSHSVPFTFNISSDKIKIHTSLNLTLWKASSGITALNEICKDVHTGADGVSKLWTDVKVTIEIDLETI